MTTDTAHRSMHARGFLFADLRGYTAFVEARGDAAAAELLRAYRDVVREVIARFHGAEIRTEGDSFYVVFPSASDAVLAGLAILEDAARAPEPIRVGVGVHAGEATETDEGYVGWAVNVAARVCAAAHADEVLVTDTVRGLTRGHTNFTFVPRGRRRLKGVAEPVPLYAVTAAGASPAPRRTAVLAGILPGARVDRLAVPLALAIGVLILTAAAIVVFRPDFGGTAREEGPTTTLVANATPTVAATTGASPTPEPDPAAERAVLNDQLRARIHPSVAPVCVDADPDEAPVYSLPLADIRAVPLHTRAGVLCELRLTDGPDVVEYWLALQETQSGTTHGRIADDAFAHVVGERNLPIGDCATETRAWGQWEFGSVGGKLLCSRFGGEALLVWTYDGTAIVARATREDDDVAILYRWWEDHARTVGVEPTD